MTTVVTTSQDGPLTANGVTPLPFTFQSISDDEIAVLREGEVADPSTYTISRDEDGTGEITPAYSWGSDEIYIYSDPDYSQPTLFQRHGAFYPDQINEPLDRLARTVISLKDRVLSQPPMAAWSTIYGRPEAFGAKANDITRAAENTIAMNACLAAHPLMLLSPGIYYTDDTLTKTNNSGGIIGAGFTQTDQNENDAGFASQIVCTSASATILQVGVDDIDVPDALVEAVFLDAFSVNRNTGPFTHASTLQGAIGIAMRWAVNCHAMRVFSLNSAIGWHFYGTVSCFYTYCSALRELEGTNAANDTFVGFYFDHNAPGPWNGGNASITLNYCRTFALTEDATPALTYSAGVRFDGGWVDTTIHGFEAGASIQYGIHGIGDGVTSTTLRTEHLTIIACVLDPGTIACIHLEDAGKQSAVVITNNYLSPSADAVGGAIRLIDMAGSVTVANNQGITVTHSGVGLAAINVNNLRAHGNIWTNIRQPIYLEDCTNFVIDDTVSNKTGTNGDFPAVQLTNCSGGRVTPIVSGNASAYPYGVMMWSTLNTKTEVNVTGINAGAIAGGAGNKLVRNGVQVTAAGAFGTNCLASGIFV